MVGVLFRGKCPKPITEMPEQIAIKDKVFELETFSCPESAVTPKIGYTRFWGRAGIVTMTVTGYPATWDERGVREILAGAVGPA